jgi:hypothetical protein
LDDDRRYAVRRSFFPEIRVTAIRLGTMMATAKATATSG